MKFRRFESILLIETLTKIIKNNNFYLFTQVSNMEMKQIMYIKKELHLMGYCGSNAINVKCVKTKYLSNLIKPLCKNIANNKILIFFGNPIASVSPIFTFIEKLSYLFIISGKLQQTILTFSRLKYLWKNPLLTIYLAIYKLCWSIILVTQAPIYFTVQGKIKQIN